MKTVNTPELDKLAEARNDGATTVLSEFLDWLQAHNYEIFGRGSDRDTWPITNVKSLVLAFLEIDPVKLEGERKALLVAIRDLNQAATEATAWSSGRAPTTE